ncbi:VWA domain-containing protein [Marinobacter bryozoorum]|uniref:vWA domain-containing protein n=1 Tax=Marinobacter bryozoorum TaxID=256324 RepID=UPI0020052723|nr:VWA domain-containing protein [Marinobacter bryozoorum]MCK7543412.1 VWA domain-containing protein [Marinobacter bryozoorum]
MIDFQFLRPLWLLVLLLVPLLIWLQRHGVASQSQWHRVIPPALLKPLLPTGRGSALSGGRARLIAPLLLMLAAVALAAPSFRSAPSPLQQQDDSLVVVLDLSLSMLATDVEPDRLTRATRKVRDLLATREGAYTALVVYAADGHVVTPLTDDRRTVEGMLSALDPVIMPAAGNRADLGVARAVELLNQGAPGRGRILLITDSLNPRYADRIRQQLTDTPWQLNGLVAGTENGAPIPLPERGFIRDGDNVVITRASLDELRNTASATGGDALEMTTTDDDITRLGLRAKDHDSWQQAARERTTERRQDDGYWLLWLTLPLALIGWRRGALALVACSLWWTPAGPAQAADWQQQWQGLWQTPEQRAPELIKDNPAEAASQLDDPLWQGTALYRDGQYDGAANAFARDNSATAHYNRGNALVRAGKPEAALDAWQEALARNPDHEGAQQNQQIVRRYLEQQGQKQQQQQASGDRQNGSSGQQNPGQGENGQGEGTPPGDSQGQGGKGRGNQQDRAQPGSDQFDGASSPDRGDTSSSEDGEPGDGGAGEQDGQSHADALSQSQEQWLRRIPDDPGGLLRRKFLQQSRSRNIQPDENDTPW